jgi:hypothetical protein
MKHGHKEKGKAKATHSGKKSSTKAGTKSKATQSAHGKKGSPKIAANADSNKSNGKNRGRSPADNVISFNNPVVAAAFKRAVKKYPSAFRRLTD